MKNHKFDQKKRIEKINECSCDKETLKLIYQWIKQDEISPKEFKELLSIKEGKK